MFKTGQELSLADKDGNAFGSLISDVPGGDTSTDIRVISGGSLTMDHLDQDDGFYQRGKMNPLLMDDPLDTNPSDGIDQLRSGTYTIANSYAQIGHGGRYTAINTTDGINAFNDKNGNIEVRVADDITMQNGTGNYFSTHIGHNDQTAYLNNGDDDLGNPRQMTMNGDITVVSENGSIVLDADHADAARTDNLVVERDADGQVIDISPSTDQTDQIPVSYNPVSIGHGGVWNNLRIQSKGDINVSAAQDISLSAGKGMLGSFAQIGHGSPDPTGNKYNDAEHHVGNITVAAGNDITLLANPNSAVMDPTNTPNGFDIEGAAAYIGHGGVATEGESIGDILVVAANDLTMTSTQRTQADMGTGTGPAASILGFTQIGHVAPRTESTIQASQSGDITVQVGGNMTMTGGSTNGTNNIASGVGTAMPVVLGYSQIGHAGPGSDGVKSGSIDITVGGEMAMNGSTSPATDGKVDGLNYVMVGHGDWNRISFSLPSNGLKLNPGTGVRSGDIYVKVGESATLDQALIGHADYNTQSSLTTIGAGNTYFGVSRNNPFQSTGTGELIARNGTVFSTAFYGFGSELRLYVPSRELNKIEQDTTLNSTRYASGTPGETGSGSGGVSFTEPFVDAGELSGRADEVYLNPDLWLQASEEGGVDFVAGDVTQQGSVAAVDDPGDLANLTALTDNGQLGDNTGTYVGGNGQVNGITNYTIYYDAVGAFTASSSGGGGGGDEVIGGGGGSVIVPEVMPFVPTPEEPVVIVTPFTPFNFLPFVDLFKFEQYERFEIIDGKLVGLISGGPADSGAAASEEEKHETEKRSRYIRQVANWNTYYQLELDSGQYNSFRLFSESNTFVK